MNLYPNTAALFPKIWRPTDGHGNDLENTSWGFGDTLDSILMKGTVLESFHKIPVYKGTSVVHTAFPGEQLGTIDHHSAGFVIFDDGTYIKNNPNDYRRWTPRTLAGFKKVITGPAGDVIVKGALSSPSGQVVLGTAEIAKDAGKTLGFIFQNWKVILIGVAIVLIILVAIKLK